MKFMCFLLIFIFLGLSILPRAYQNAGTKGSCVAECCEEYVDVTNDYPKHSDNCNDKNCNPFQSCCCSMGFIVKSEVYIAGFIFEPQQILNLFRENPISHYHSSVWQPPKIA